MPTGGLHSRVLLLDGSAAMNSTADFQPTRLLAMRPYLFSLVRNYFAQCPLALLSIVVLRDGVAHRICGLTNSTEQLLSALDKRYFLAQGSGFVSLENALRIGLVELLSKSSTSKSMDMLLLFGSVSVVDAGDVLELIRSVALRGILCNVISLCGGAHIATHLAQSTGGRLLCPMSAAHLHAIFEEMVVVASLDRRKKKKMMQVSKRQRSALAAKHPLEGEENEDVEDEEDDRFVTVGFPIPASAQLQQNSGGAGIEAKQQPKDAVVNNNNTDNAEEELVKCPRCFGTLLKSSVPCTCAICDLFLTSASLLYYAALVAKPAVSPHVPLCSADKGKEVGEGEEERRYDGVVDSSSSSSSYSSSLSCRCCHTTVSRCSKSHDKKAVSSSSSPSSSPCRGECTGCRCSECGMVCCFACAEYLRCRLRICPGCVKKK